MLNRRSWNKKWMLVLGAVTILALASVSQSGSRQSELIEIFKQKLWVTIRSTAYPPDGIRITARVGDAKRVVYSERPGDVAAGHAALSPDGTKVAFGKTVRIEGETGVLLRVCTAAIDGSSYTEIIELADLYQELAWSHNQEKLAFLGSLGKGPLELVVLDLATRPPTVLLHHPLPKSAGHPLPGQMSYINLTTQAWAPDNRRLVYVNADGRVVILDVTSKAEEDLGPGNDPTWSRDGAFIAYRDDAFRRAPGDYFIVPVHPPRQPRRILKNASATGGLRGSRGFLGPPLWSPDDQFLLIMRLVGPGESQRPNIVGVPTGEIVQLPIGSMGDMKSWGGKK